MRPHYDFSKGVRGKYAARYAEGVTIVIPPAAKDEAKKIRTEDARPTSTTGRAARQGRTSRTKT